MSQEPPNPHDALVKALLDAPERAGALIRENVPEPVSCRLADSDPEPLPGSFIDPELRETHSDRLFRVALVDGRSAFVHILIEHKSEPDVATPLQLDTYRNRIWRRYADQDEAGRAARYRALPPVFPLVLYHGQREWTVPLSVMECVDADEELLAFQREGGYWVRHLRADEFDAALSSRGDLRAGLLALAMAHLEELSWVEVARILQNLPEGHVLERALLRYIARVYATTEEQVHRALEETRPERAQELAMTVAEEWIERGKEQGRQEGEARLLLWLLEQKFGAETVAFYRVTIEQASEEAVKDWSARVLAAERIEDVFRG